MKLFSTQSENLIHLSIQMETPHVFPVLQITASVFSKMESKGEWDFQHVDNNKKLSLNWDKLDFETHWRKH